MITPWVSRDPLDPIIGLRLPGGNAPLVFLSVRDFRSRQVTRLRIRAYHIAGPVGT
jgi:hypothetical protein